MLNRIMNTAVRGLAIVVAMVCVLGAAPAMAQFGMGGPGEGMMNLTLTRRGVEAYAKILGLDDEQTDVALTLLEGHQTAHKTMMKEVQLAMQGIQERVQETGDPSVFQKELPRMTREFTEKSESLEKGFFDDLRAVASEAQLANWAGVERHRRRETGLRFGFVSGQAVDLIAVVERSRARPENPQVFDELLGQYEMEMDKDILVIEKMGKDAQKDMVDSGAMFDMTKIQKMMREFYGSAARLRDTNRDYARRLMPLMDAEHREAFDAEVKRRSFPRIYKVSHTAKVLGAALAFDDLDATQREALTTLAAAYGRDAAVANEKWAKATEEREAEAGGTIMVMMEGMMGGGKGNDVVSEARSARKDIDSKAKDKLLAVLREDQRARLPQAEPDPQNPWVDFMPNEDDDDEAGDIK